MPVLAELRKAKDKVIREQVFLNNLFRFMPMGYLRLSIIRDEQNRPWVADLLRDIRIFKKVHSDYFRFIYHSEYFQIHVVHINQIAVLVVDFYTGRDI